ncbi:MAG: hypothetical protein KAI61_02910 [Alphaproteobacteria bacterium]|nr:hypothetical protein [Alphaproteobacteria bacterium]MCK5518340.1 hypothetical protein [Alphaproteobacteria bacterium]MCK5556092.1 hypothetical protein [Alphaproteobacteria bacterium]MCK5658359.1 hypothetical protein [Alphaproteobacteria bacterium]
MVQPQWTKLNREQAQRVLRLLSNHKDAVVFSQELTGVSWRGLSFYADYRLYRLVNYATMPTFTMTYLSNGSEYISLDGTANPIYTVNEKDPLRLDNLNVIPYLEFFFSYVQGSEGDVSLIKDPYEINFMEGMDSVQQQSVIDNFKSLKILSCTTENSYKISGTLYYGGALITSTILIMPDGKISFQDQSLLLSGIPFQESPYRQAWIEG